MFKIYLTKNDSIFYIKMNSINVKHRCLICRTPTILHCKKCQLAYYCSKKCQESDWDAHKHICVEIIPKVCLFKSASETTPYVHPFAKFARFLTESDIGKRIARIIPNSKHQYDMTGFSNPFILILHEIGPDYMHVCEGNSMHKYKLNQDYCDDKWVVYDEEVTVMIDLQLSEYLKFVSSFFRKTPDWTKRSTNYYKHPYAKYARKLTKKDIGKKILRVEPTSIAKDFTGCDLTFDLTLTDIEWYCISVTWYPHGYHVLCAEYYDDKWVVENDVEILMTEDEKHKYLEHHNRIFDF